MQCGKAPDNQSPQLKNTILIPSCSTWFKNCGENKHKQTVKTLKRNTLNLEPCIWGETLSMCQHYKFHTMQANFIPMLSLWKISLNKMRQTCSPFLTITKAKTLRFESTMHPRTDLRLLSPSRRGL
jgi:hypothetical protein